MRDHVGHTLLIGVRHNIPVKITERLAGSLKAAQRERNHLERVRDVANALDCPEPFCLARPGDPCVARVGHTLRTSHKRRRARAEQIVRRLVDNVGDVRWADGP